MAIWSEWTIWDIRGRLSTESHEQQEKGSYLPVQEERPSTCQHVRQRRSPCSRPLKLPQCSGLTRRPSPAGRRQASSRPSGLSAATAGTGRLRYAHCLRAFRSSARSNAWLLPGPEVPGGLGVRCSAASKRPARSTTEVRGGRPRRPVHRIGGRASRRCDCWASVSRRCRGRSGLLVQSARWPLRTTTHALPPGTVPCPVPSPASCWPAVPAKTAESSAREPLPPRMPHLTHRSSVATSGNRPC